MPTGYTSVLYEGEREQTFEDFALRCARGFGSFIYQRDESLDEPPRLPSLDEESYYPRALASAEDELRYWKNLDGAELERVVEETYKSNLLQWEKSVIERAKRKSRYESMLNKVRDWEPPTSDHAEFKKFMIDQLEQSLDFDCGSEYSMPERVSAEDYRKQQIDSIKHMISFYEEQLEKRKEQIENARQWGIDLFESLGVAYEQ